MRQWPSIKDRIEDKVMRDAVTGCWHWLGATKGRKTLPYGAMMVNNQAKLAHRVAYEEYIGPIPAGLTIDHLCRNSLCINPHHLEPVTQGVNNLRGKGMAYHNRNKTRCKHGHEYTEENTYIRPDGYRDCRKCGIQRSARSAA